MEVVIILDHVFGVDLNSEVFFTKDSLDLKVGTLNIGFNDNLQSFVGQITLNLNVEHENSNPIPESSTFFLFGTGLFSLTAWRYYQIRRE